MNLVTTEQTETRTRVPEDRHYDMLRTRYRADPNDSHPNERANQTITPQFADFRSGDQSLRGRVI